MRIDLLFDIERGIVGKPAEQRLALRQELSAPVLADLKDWMQAERRKLSRHSPVTVASASRQTPSACTRRTSLSRSCSKPRH